MRTDGRDETDGRLSKFSESVRKWFKYIPNEINVSIIKFRNGTCGDLYQ